MAGTRQRFFSTLRIAGGGLATCLACGARLPPNACFCTDCGVDMAGQSHLAGRVSRGDELAFTAPNARELGPIVQGRRGGTNLTAARALFAAFVLQHRGGETEILRCLDSVPVTPLDYQVEAAHRALYELHGRAILADEVGLGKTIEAGLCIRELLDAGKARAILILVPSSLSEQWKGELEEKFDILAVDHDSPDLGRARVVLLSLTRAKTPPLGTRLKRRKWDLVVVDEAHGLKNSRTIAHRFVRSLKTLRVLLLTATPIENELRELYNLMALVDGSLFPTYRKFAQRFLRSRYEVRDVAELRRFCSQFLIRRRRAAVFPEMPPRTAEVIPYKTSAQEFQFYRRVVAYVRGLHKREEGGKQNLLVRGAALFTTLLLKESCSSPEAVVATLGQSEFLQNCGSSQTELQLLIAEGLEVGVTGKMRAFCSTVARLDHSAVAYVEFFATHQRLHSLLREDGVEVIPYTGRMSAGAKTAALERFREHGGLLLCTEVGGQGLNLQNCRIVLNYDIPWNPMRLEQRVGRVHRYGQKYKTQVIHFISPGTFEAHIFDVLTRKLGLFRQVIGEVEAVLSFLEEEEGLQQMLAGAVCLSSDDEDMERRFAELKQRVDVARSRYQRSIRTTVALLDDET
jgi:SNF2 family DNA or RNA helicase